MHHLGHYSLDLGFWFCDSAHDGPCQIFCRALFDEQYPFRLLVLVLCFIFLSLVQIIYYACCVICPFLICQCYTNPPESWLLYNDDDWAAEKETATALSILQTKQHMNATGTFDYRISYSDFTANNNSNKKKKMNAKETGTSIGDDDDDKSAAVVNDACPICLHSYHDDPYSSDDGDHDDGILLVRSIHCRHVYHEDCLASWLCRGDDSSSKNNCCPCCRVQILVPPSSNKNGKNFM